MQKNLPKVIKQLCPEYDWNPHTVDCKSNALPVAPPIELLSSIVTTIDYLILTSPVVRVLEFDSMVTD